MEFFDNLVLPQSAEHIRLINYLLVLILFLFIPYTGILLVSSILSVFYRGRGLNTGVPLYTEFAASVIHIPTYNKSIGIILGMIPFLTIAFMASQIMHGTGTFILQFLFTSFLLGVIGVILIYTYRYSFDFSGIYGKIKNKIPDGEIDHEIESKTAGSIRLASRAGLWGIISLAAALWFLIASTTMMIDPVLWKADSIYVLSSWKVMVYFLQFLAISAAVTGAALLFFNFYWDGGNNELQNDLSEMIKKLGLNLTFWSSLSIPLLILVTVFLVNPKYLSTGVFTASVIALILLLLIYILIYGIFKDSNIKLSGPVFFLVLFTALFLIIKDQAAMANATEQNAVILDQNFQKYLAGITGGRGAAEVSGKEIFDVRCSSCHRFDQKLVGPAYNDVLDKYKGKQDQLTGFILNPVKVDPQYPPMPNPGLKPNEAKAVAGYLLENYKK